MGGARRVALAAVAGAHGVSGELRLKLFTDTAESLAQHAAVFVGGRERRLLSAKAAGKGATARLEGVNDRAAAESLRGSLIEVDRGSLPPLDEGEYYHADLTGMPCIDLKGTALGTISAVENFGAGDLLEVEDAAGKRALVPFKPGIADLENGQVVIDPAFLA
ncbi:ribosome maturation factor RimM [uncultured Sphingomonas sp.]|uniref:ribosome maturation factor RimM n=1 Tax=uncultured Sphingomonas sp. TaxID=158754 RepID=UPI0025D5E3A5|nr:ribosome maturation factor RimM [uncultured Sphingomonas sp.]